MIVDQVLYYKISRYVHALEFLLGMSPKSPKPYCVRPLI